MRPPPCMPTREGFKGDKTDSSDSSHHHHANSLLVAHPDYRNKNRKFVTSLSCVSQETEENSASFLRRRGDALFCFHTPKFFRGKFKNLLTNYMKHGIIIDSSTKGGYINEAESPAKQNCLSELFTEFCLFEHAVLQEEFRFLIVAFLSLAVFISPTSF